MFTNKIRSFFQKDSNPRIVTEIVATILGVSLTITVLRLLGVFQPLEWQAYDALFFLKPTEPTDERIVLVTWDESKIQMLEESIISDDTLVSVLKKIRSQEPRLIGLDLYRDIPVNSPRLTDKQNSAAYDELKKIFRSTPNLFGIQKVLEPKVKPPKILEEEGRVTASDVPSDGDNYLRRSYVFPEARKPGENKELLPYLGVVLGYQYLEKEGFTSQESNKGWLQFANQSTPSQTTLPGFNAFSGGYVWADDASYSFLVNWRKVNSGNSPFRTVSVSELLAGQVSEDIFRDRIVLIGNTSASTSDRYYLPTDRWERPSPQYTYGVEVPAQVASNIISAVLDERPLIRVLPDWSEYALLFLSVTGIVFVAEKNRSRRPKTLFLITFASAAVTGVSLVIFGIAAFTEGLWIPVVPAIAGVFTTSVTICLLIYINKINKAVEDFQQLFRDFNHSIGNPLGSIDRNASVSLATAQKLEEAGNLEEFEFFEELEDLEEKLGAPPFTSLRRNLARIYAEAKRIGRSRDNTKEYININYLGTGVFPKAPTDLNKLIQKTVRETFSVLQLSFDCEIKLQENYDSSITTVEINQGAIQRVLENLIDNAFYAVQDRKNKFPEYNPIIGVQTQRKPDKIEVIVYDNGVGIPDAIVEEIFLPYKSFRAFGKGSGLGLFLVKENLRRHEGSIKVETELNQGSKFIVSLPG